MAPGLGIAALGLAMVWGQGQPGAASPAPRPCARAALVDGQLRCDDELPAVLASLCADAGGGAGAGPGAGPGLDDRSEPLVAGDVVDTAQLCAHRGVVVDGETPGRSRMAPEDLVALDQPVDLNRASPLELTSLPRIGPVLARRIVEGRPYRDLDALGRVRGIGPATLHKLRSRVTFGDPPL